MKYHTDGALIFQKDESHTLHDMQESMAEKNNAGEFDQAEMVQKGMKTMINHVMSRDGVQMDGYHAKRDNTLPTSLTVQAIME